MTDTTQLDYLNGFGNEHETEAIDGALPKGCFSPQKVAYGLYAEQFSSTAFTAPRADNRRTWLYRIQPSVKQSDYQPADFPHFQSAIHADTVITPQALRWNPYPETENPLNFIESITTYAINGQTGLSGTAIHRYCATKSMNKQSFSNADAEMVIVPQQGQLNTTTEMGKLEAVPGEILVIPRGVKFSINLSIGMSGDTADKPASGYICENHGSPLTLPERGPVGANGFANDRDFQYPVACYEDVSGQFECITKFNGQFFRSEMSHSPMDVVAWVGNSAPYKYDLSRFNVINTVSYDHPDPSIFTVLTSKSDTPGVANLDFVIFPPRWMVAENTFRPPWFHRNIMSEFMGLIQGQYDAKEQGFLPGGASLHNAFTPHGPEAGVFTKASNAELKPVQYKDTMAFMFESRYPYSVTRSALNSPNRQKDYNDCWQSLARQFSINK
ncbi:homogentisate 1,2-dioxygenase [Endozoicomonas sp. OPT23]|uniref:homogentisate 1,2-dioxygenase n=1 Tax=Endozoicomonas sp. OPT23 TaxID=2072845 RepID=UPI00129B4724|nr:homogentisate 1,2-dioxygenase [Endozoicomonas sp. OPT23]MRI34849.1 homogentisate 1,2-dioxygenase [Endozoicomonas sp. OPT23]